MLYSDTDAVEYRALLENFSSGLQELLRDRADVLQALPQVVPDPYDLSSYDLENDLRLFEHLGTRLAQGLAVIIDTELAHASEAEAVAAHG